MADIEHTGQVVSISGDKAHVKILQASACSGCQARSMCMSADVKEKYMDCEMLEPLAVGDSVRVLISESMGWKAVTIAYIVPFLILVIGVTVLTKLGYSEAVAGLGSIAAAAVYFAIAWLCRRKIEKQFSFRVTKK